MSPRRTEGSPIPSWHEHGTCSKVTLTDPAMASAWIQRDHPLADEAKQYCRGGCPVREMCARDALLDRQAQGIRAGFYFEVGRITREDSIQIRREIAADPPLPNNRVYFTRGTADAGSEEV